LHPKNLKLTSAEYAYLEEKENEYAARTAFPVSSFKITGQKVVRRGSFENAEEGVAFSGHRHSEMVKDIDDRHLLKIDGSKTKEPNHSVV
jgi:hypothetical protein